MAQIKVNVEIIGKNFNFTYKQLINKLSKLNYYDFLDFFDNNSKDKFNCFNTKKNKNQGKKFVVDAINNEFNYISNIHNEKKLDNMEYNRQMERTSIDAPIYPHGWYEKQDNQIIKGENNDSIW